MVVVGLGLVGVQFWMCKAFWYSIDFVGVSA